MSGSVGGWMMPAPPPPHPPTYPPTHPPTYPPTSSGESLRNAPPPEDLLADLIQVLSRQQERDLPTTLEGRLGRLLHYLRQGRCLVLLDNAESILQSGDRTGRYRSGFEGYGEVLRLCRRDRPPELCDRHLAGEAQGAGGL